MARIDYDSVAGNYAAARGLTEDGLAGWREALAQYLSGLTRPLVDVGSGAGQFANLFPSWFGIEVIGVEPSEGMRAEAEGARIDPRVHFLAGTAEQLPLPDASCAAAWISTVIHHIADLGAAAKEVRRVLAPGSPVLIRSAFPGRTHGISLFRYFPEAAQVVESFPSIEQVRREFGEAGFALESVQSVPQVSVPNLAAMRPRVALRADTTLLRITDEAFAAGLARLDAAIASGQGDQVPVDYLDLLVLR
ncbi:MAG: class I SAM-dependent methyltransferase [bacterium]